MEVDKKVMTVALDLDTYGLLVQYAEYGYPDDPRAINNALEDIIYEGVSQRAELLQFV